MSEINLGDFLAEAEELLDRLNHGLLELDRAVKSSAKQNPATINDIFRAAHSLKGICGMFGFGEVGEIAHKMEDLLDRLRLGKLKLTAASLDMLFAVTEELRAIISRKAAGEQIAPDEIQKLKENLKRVEEAREEAAETDWLKQSGIAADILAVLTEYEEHRLVENLKEGMSIIQVSANFDLSDFDKKLTGLQARLKELGELITTLPSADAAGENKIIFFLILGSELAEAGIKPRIEDFPVSVTLLRPGKGHRPEKPAEAGKKPAPDVKQTPECEVEPDHETEAGEHEEISTVRSLSRTVRVDIGKLDDLMNIVGELVLSKNVIAQLMEKLRNQLGFTEMAIDLYKVNRNLERKLQELQQSVLEVRMVPIGQIYDKLRRNVRKLARETGKEVEFVAEGGDTELDKLIIEDLADPLMHIIRNSIDHGIEPVAERQRLGKPDQGQIKLRAFQRGNHVVIEISDNGTGLDFNKIKNKGIELGFLNPGEEIKQEELVQLIFAPGFSTADKVSELSGRGVGLDVVKNNISVLSGAIDIESEAGVGSKVVITLPITLAIIQALIVESGTETFAIPLNSVASGLSIKPGEISTIEGREVIEQRERTLPLLRLDRFFRLAAKPRTAEEDLYVVTVGIAERRLGIVVDRLLGRQDIVIKSIGRVLSGIKGVAGATELGDQRTILVLDVLGMIDEATSSLGSGRLNAGVANVS